MSFINTKTPPEKGSFEYKPWVLKKYGRIFSTNEIGKYSSKIKSICDSIYNKKTNTVSEGIILIHSNFIDGGLIPMALALEEMGFQKWGTQNLFKSGAGAGAPIDVHTMQKIIKTDAHKTVEPAKYVIITGDPRLSPNNAQDVIALTTNNNHGQKIKVVLISQAGSEGLDFKAIRQIHNMESWYNTNRTEQIIGRGVRNDSHINLEFKKRNVQIFLHGTKLTNPHEESADLYIYRTAEQKAIQMGKITRLLKETAIDCNINAEQNLFLPENFNTIKGNRHLKQQLSNGLVLDKFELGDKPGSSICDYMDNCTYTCKPLSDVSTITPNLDTYSEPFMIGNLDKIIQKIKYLMKEKFFYTRTDLIKLINNPKVYPIIQIYAALTRLIEDSSEHILDQYNRSGHLVNIGENYMFQPIELDTKNISIFDRSVPIDHKFGSLKINNDNTPISVSDDINIKLRPIATETKTSPLIIDQIYSDFNKTLNPDKLTRGEDDWNQICGNVIKYLSEKYSDTDDITNQLLDAYADHVVESLHYTDYLDLLYFFNLGGNIEECSTASLTPSTDTDKSNIEYRLKKSLCSKIVRIPGMIAISFINTDVNTMKETPNLVYVHKDLKWTIATSPERSRFNAQIAEPKFHTNNIVIGFLALDPVHKYMTFKTKDMTNLRNKGARCDQSNKKEVIKILNKIFETQEYEISSKRSSEMSKTYLCIVLEFVLRLKESMSNPGDDTWFVDPVTARIHFFQ